MCAIKEQGLQKKNQLRKQRWLDRIKEGVTKEDRRHCLDMSNQFCEVPPSLKMRLSMRPLRIGSCCVRRLPARAPTMPAIRNFCHIVSVSRCRSKMRAAEPQAQCAISARCRRRRSSALAAHAAPFLPRSLSLWVVLPSSFLLWVVLFPSFLLWEACFLPLSFWLALLVSSSLEAAYLLLCSVFFPPP